MSAVASPPTRPAHTGGGTSVAKALGSSTRSEIFDHLREVGEDRTVRDIAGGFDLHPNVARTHLELLADAGLVEVGRRKHPGGGRPAKVYRARANLDIDELENADEPTDGAPVLVGLLADLLGDVDGDELVRRAHAAATAEGRRLVAGASAAADLPTAAATVVRALQRIAPGVRTLQVEDEWVDVVGVDGVFGALADRAPDLADVLERGLVSGAFEGAGMAVTLADAGSADDGQPVWRARRATGTSARVGAVPAATVDTRGEQQERGVVQAMRTVTRLATGEVLEVLAEGPGSPAVFARWADRAGHKLLGVERATDPRGRPAIRLLIRKGA